MWFSNFNHYSNFLFIILKFLDRNWPLLIKTEIKIFTLIKLKMVFRKSIFENFHFINLWNIGMWNLTHNIKTASYFLNGRCIKNDFDSEKNFKIAFILFQFLRKFLKSHIFHFLHKFHIRRSRLIKSNNSSQIFYDFHQRIVIIYQYRNLKGLKVSKIYQFYNIR